MCLAGLCPGENRHKTKIVAAIRAPLLDKQSKVTAEGVLFGFQNLPAISRLDGPSISGIQLGERGHLILGKS